MITAMVTKITKVGRTQSAHLYIKEWMDHLGISDEKAGNRLGKARETIYRWRTEQNRLNPIKQAQLAAALDIDPQAFFRPPEQPSLDAIMADAPDDVRAAAVDIVKRLARR